MRILIVIMTVLIFSYSMSDAADVYFKINLGYSFNKFSSIIEDDSLEIGQLKSVQSNAPVFEAELGYKIQENHRIGLSIGFLKSDYSQSFDFRDPNRNEFYVSVFNIEKNLIYYIENQLKINSFAALAQYRYVFDNLPHMKPYIKIGMGISHNRTSTAQMIIPFESMKLQPVNSKMNHISPAFNIGIGANISIINALGLDINFKYFDYGQSSRSSQILFQYDETNKSNIDTQESYTFSSKLRGFVASIGISYSF